jgi:hypothetical protein
MNDHLIAYGKPDPKGWLHCFWCPNKTSTLHIGTLGTLIIVKNGFELRKLQPQK